MVFNYGSYNFSYNANYGAYHNVPENALYRIVVLIMKIIKTLRLWSGLAFLIALIVVLTILDRIGALIRLIVWGEHKW